MPAWRAVNRIIHRDAGYLCFGLTLLYAISGILLNHLHDWNSNYSIEKIETTVELSSPGDELSPDGIAALLQELGEEEDYRGTFRPDPTTLQIFFEGRVLTVNLETGAISGEVVRKRKVLSALNALHLNNAGKTWTWFADLYGGVLALLAVTGIFMIHGKNGIAGRGAWLTAGGIVLPLMLAWLLI